MSTVWVANYSGHPYDDAKRFGELDYLTRGYVSLGNLDRLFYTVIEAVYNTEPEDYLLLSGLSIISCIAAVAWLRKHGSVTLLHWDKKTRKYVPLEFTRDQIDKMFDIFVAREAEEKWRKNHE